MSLREQPYLPLYVQDFMTDEKLNDCSAESQGVYIRLMCLMHKSEQYGAITLKQKDKQNDKQILNFAYKLVRQMPFDVDTIVRSLTELLEENVLMLDGDTLFQKRMVRDGELSEKRANAGFKGGKGSSVGKQSESKTPSKTASKTQANTENEIESENESENEKEGSKGKKRAKSTPPNPPEDIFKAYAGDDDQLLAALRGFEEMRKKLKAPLTDRARELTLKNLDKFSADVRDKARYKRECLEQSILKSWRGVFALKDFVDSPEPPPSQERRPDKPIDYDPSKNWEDYVT